MRRFLPSLSALQAFDVAARHLSFTRAAEELSLTQSAVSRHINNLEASLGLRLFERTGTRLVLTDIGRSLAEDVRSSLDRLEEVTIDAVRGRRASAALSIALPSTFALRWLMPRLQAFTAAHRDLPLDIQYLHREAEQESFCASVDIAILRGVGGWSKLRARKLIAEELVVVAAPCLAQKAIAASDTINFNVIPTLQNGNRPSLWLTWLRAGGRSYDGAIQGLRLPSNELLIQAAVAGQGFAVVPSIYVTGELASGALVAPYGAPLPSGESYWVVIAEERAHRPHLLPMRDWLLREAAKNHA